MGTRLRVRFVLGVVYIFTHLHPSPLRHGMTHHVLVCLVHIDGTVYVNVPDVYGPYDS